MTFTLCPSDLFIVDGAFPGRNSCRRFRIDLGLRRRKCKVNVILVHACRLCVFVAVNVVSVLQDGDLVARQCGHFIGDQGRSSTSQVCVSKDDVDFGQFSTCGFRVEDPDDREEDAIREGEEQEGVGTNGGGHGRQDLNDQKVEKPIAHGGDGVGLSSNGLRVQFGGVQPGKGEPRGTEERDEEVEPKRGTLGRPLPIGQQASESDEHGDSLTDGTDQEHGSSTASFNEDERRDGEDGVDDGQDTTEDKRELSLEANLIFEENGGVVNDGVATTELLEDLGRGPNKHSSEVLLLAALEQFLGRTLGLLSSDDAVEDHVSLMNSSRVVNAGTVQSRDDLETFVESAMGQKPSRRFAQGESAPHQEDGENDLKSDGQSP